MGGQINPPPSLHLFLLGLILSYAFQAAFSLGVFTQMTSNTNTRQCTCRCRCESNKNMCKSNLMKMLMQEKGKCPCFKKNSKCEWRWHKRRCKPYLKTETSEHWHCLCLHCLNAGVNVLVVCQHVDLWIMIDYLFCLQKGSLLIQ